MAALQKIRSTSWILILMGVGLFLFLLTMVLDQKTISMITEGTRNAGVVGGEKLSAQDYLDEVNEALEVRKMTKGGNLSEAEQQQVRDEVWQQFVQYTIVRQESEKFGFRVTETEVQNALREGTAAAFQNMPFFIDQNTGKFDYKNLQGFLAQFSSIGDAAQNNEQLTMVKKMWAYTEKQLRRELLFTKYANLMQASFTANKLVAKSTFDDRNTKTNATIAVLPFSKIADKEVKITDADLQAVYKTHKELFLMAGKSSDIKYIDVAVKPSASDQAALNKEMGELYTKLQSSTDPASIINASKSTLRYTPLPLSAESFPQDIAAQLDSMAVGATTSPYSNVSDNTMNVVKLISKIQAPDSVKVFMLALQDADSKKLATRADSVLNALNSGAKFADIAKRYAQPSDSSWITAQQLNTPTTNEDNIKLINSLYNQAMGSYTAIDMNGGKVIVKVAERKAIKPKYVAAIAKVPMNFSTTTYNDALSKFNRFAAANRDLATLEKNAAKEGYTLISQDKITTSAANVGANGQFPGVSGSKEAIRWIFDSADEGEVSPVYEVGSDNDHLLLVAVVKQHKAGYLPWDDAQVKDYLTALATSEKKAEIAAKKLAGVKTVEQAKSKGALVQNYQSNFANSQPIAAVAQPEPALDGVLAATAQGKTTALVLGRAGAYIGKVTSRTKGSEKFDNKTEMRNLQMLYTRMAGQQLFNNLMLKAKIEDTRYKF